MAPDIRHLLSLVQFFAYIINLYREQSLSFCFAWGVCHRFDFFAVTGSRTVVRADNEDVSMHVHVPFFWFVFSVRQIDSRSWQRPLWSAMIFFRLWRSYYVGFAKWRLLRVCTGHWSSQYDLRIAEFAGIILRGRQESGMDRRCGHYRHKPFNGHFSFPSVSRS